MACRYDPGSALLAGWGKNQVRLKPAALYSQAPARIPTMGSSKQLDCLAAAGATAVGRSLIGGDRLLRAWILAAGALGGAHP